MAGRARTSERARAAQRATTRASRSEPAGGQPKKPARRQPPRRPALRSRCRGRRGGSLSGSRAELRPLRRGEEPEASPEPVQPSSSWFGLVRRPMMTSSVTPSRPLTAPHDHHLHHHHHNHMGSLAAGGRAADALLARQRGRRLFCRRTELPAGQRAAGRRAWLLARRGRFPSSSSSLLVFSSASSSPFPRSPSSSGCFLGASRALAHVPMQSRAAVDFSHVTTQPHVVTSHSSPPATLPRHTTPLQAPQPCRACRASRRRGSRGCTSQRRRSAPAVRLHQAAQRPAPFHLAAALGRLVAD